LSTEEDGVDEAGRTSQPPLIMAPPDLIADPDGDATDTIVDNGIMSSSRTGTGSSRSGASKRAAGANGNSSTSGDPEAAAPEATTGEDTTEAGSSTTVPLPADTIRKAKEQSDSSGATEDKGRSSERQGSRKTMSSGESAWVTARKTETAEPADSADAVTAAAPAAPAANKTSPVKDDRKPSFTPTAATPAVSAPAAAVSTAAPATAAPTTATPATSAPQASSYSAAGASSPSGYSRSAWSAAADATAASGPAPAPAPARPAPAGDNGRPSGNGFSTGAAASTVTGAAAGLANSVSSAWQKRGSASARTIKTRKSTKRQAMLTLARVEPWSVMKFSFVASVVAFIILFVAVAVLYMVLSALGVFDSLQHTVSSITSSQSDAGTNISHWFSASLILGYTAMLGALNIVLITAMSTVGSVIYNLIAKTIGGIEVTLRETD
jgi:hypothetical protein